MGNGEEELLAMSTVTFTPLEEEAPRQASLLVQDICNGAGNS